MGVTPWYCTREQVKAATETVETARNNARVDIACEAATEAVHQLCRRTFYPWIGTQYFDWPAPTDPSPYRVWTGDLLSVTTLVAGGTTISSGNYFLYPPNASRFSEPYRWIELDKADLPSWETGDTEQRNIAVTGTWGYTSDTVTAGATAEELDASETGVDISDSSLIGIGDVILVGAEYMVVTGRSLLTSSQTVQTPMTASSANTVCAVTTGSAFHAGEMITLDSERMMVEDVAGNTLIVRRAADGTALATHTGSTIYAPRTLTVVRGALGSTAAAHVTSSAITRHRVPSLVNRLAVAEAVNILLSEESGWARTPGEGVSARPASGAGLPDLRNAVLIRYGLQAQQGAV